VGGGFGKTPGTTWGEGFSWTPLRAESPSPLGRRGPREFSLRRAQGGHFSLPQRFCLAYPPTMAGKQIPIILTLPMPFA